MTSQPVPDCASLNLHALKHMQSELTEDYRDMIHAAAEIENRREAFLRKWRLNCRAVVDSLDDAGGRLFTFTGPGLSQWKSARTTKAIKHLSEEFRRRIKTHTVLPCAETVRMLLWALMTSGQIQMRKVDGWETLAHPLARSTLTSRPDQAQLPIPGERRRRISTSFETRRGLSPANSRSEWETSRGQGRSRRSALQKFLFQALHPHESPTATQTATSSRRHLSKPNRSPPPHTREFLPIPRASLFTRHATR